MSKTNKLTFSAICCALSIVLLYIASIIKTGTIAIQFITGVILMTAVSKSGITYGIFCYIVTAILCLFVLPDKSVAITYFVFFGLIPIVKFFGEKFSRISECFIKTLCFLIISIILYYLFKAMLPAIAPVIIILAVVVSAVFYDILLSFAFPFVSRYLQKPLT